MKKYEWFFQTTEPNARVFRVIASTLESARSLVADHLGTRKFKQIKVKSFFESGCDPITIEEPPTAPVSHFPEQPKREEEAFDLKATFEAFENNLKSGNPLPSVDPVKLRCVRELGRNIVSEDHARGGTGQIAIGVSVYQHECGVQPTDMPALMFRNALIEMLLMKGDVKEAELNDALFQAIATVPVDDSFTPDILSQRVREQLGNAPA